MVLPSVHVGLPVQVLVQVLPVSVGYQYVNASLICTGTNQSIIDPFAASEPGVAFGGGGKPG
jgi:hypothetical protein